MSEAVKFLRRLMESRISEIHTCITGRVVKYDAGRADVQPSGLPLLVGVPTISWKRKIEDVYKTYPLELEVGDTVLVIFLERARDGTGNRKHDLSDGVIIGVIA